MPTVIELGLLLEKDHMKELATQVVHWNDQFGEESNRQSQKLPVLRPYRIKCQELRALMRLQEALWRCWINEADRVSTRAIMLVGGGT